MTKYLQISICSNVSMLLAFGLSVPDVVPCLTLVLQFLHQHIYLWEAIWSSVYCSKKLKRVVRRSHTTIIMEDNRSTTWGTAKVLKQYLLIHCSNFFLYEYLACYSACITVNPKQFPPKRWTTFTKRRGWSILSEPLTWWKCSVWFKKNWT